MKKATPAAFFFHFRFFFHRNPAQQHHIGSKHAIPIVEPTVAAALFCGMLYSP